MRSSSENEIRTNLQRIKGKGELADSKKISAND